MPVDLFLKYLAAERGESAGCVILSGTGTDGTQGLRLIKEKGGLVVAQSEGSARHAGMPVSAVDTGLVDYVFSPSEMPGQLMEYFRHPAPLSLVPEDHKKKEPDPLRRILSFLAERTRHDFSLYKDNTLTRRIERRMTVTRSHTPSEYLQCLHRDPAEIRALFQELLIGVTSFFRDPEAFAYLKEKVLPELISRKRKGHAFRAWIPGCSTGEEAFSVAILVQELLEEANIGLHVQIFGTDIDPKAIETARLGIYVQNIAADVAPERISRFFTQEDRYRVKREIRETVVFAEQNVLRDAPFSNLDLLVCRNLLIYLKPEAHARLLPLFHYTLQRDGILFLGKSESVSRSPELFEPIAKQFSIYRKRNGVISPLVQFPTGPTEFKTAAERRSAEWPLQGAEHLNVAQAAEKVLMKEFTPASVIVNQNQEIIHFHGRTGKYLEPAPGKPNMRIADMAREGLSRRRQGSSQLQMDSHGVRASD